jgi:molecular chaperone DnaJ
LYLRIKLKAHKKFIRDNYDIRTEQHISVKQAILGDKIDIETIHGPLKLKIPEGTQSNTIFKLREKGITKLHDRGLGDQYVKVIVDIPKNLDRKRRQALEGLDI